jgi:hypothetical protein
MFSEVVLVDIEGNMFIVTESEADMVVLEINGRSRWNALQTRRLYYTGCQNHLRG